MKLHTLNLFVSTHALLKYGTLRCRSDIVPGASIFLTRFVQVVTYSFRRRPLSCLRPPFANHESYTRRRCEGPMEGRSIIHKMHVLERSFLPKLKYSTSHSYHPFLLPEPIPSGTRLSASISPWRRHLVVVDHHRQWTLPFTPSPVCKCFLVSMRIFILYELASLFDRSIKSSAKSCWWEFCNALKPVLASSRSNAL